MVRRMGLREREKEEKLGVRTMEKSEKKRFDVINITRLP